MLDLRPRPHARPSHRAETLATGDATVRAESGDVDAAADYLAIDLSLVRAAVDYDTAFLEDVNADAVFAQRVAQDEGARWERG